MKEIKLGDRVRDRVTGFTGIAVSKTVWLEGCVRFQVQGEKLEGGKPSEAQHYDESSLTVVKAGVLQAVPPGDGGPKPAPQRARDPVR